MIVKVVFVYQNICVLITVIQSSWWRAGQSRVIRRNARTDRRAPWEHLQHTGAHSRILGPSPGDWNTDMIGISPQRHVARDPVLSPTCPSRVDMCSLWLAHYGVSISPGHWGCPGTWDSTAKKGLISLSLSWGLGKKEKYVLICCSICISTFAVNFGLDFDKWVSRLTENCVFSVK